MESADDLVARARALQPLIRQAAAEGDRERRMPQRLAEAFAAAGLYRTQVVRSLGGYEADPVSAIRVIEAGAEADGSAGWNLMVGIETAGIASCAVTPEAAAETFLADPGLTMAGALPPRGHARPVDGGWRLSGRWPFASGCQNASWIWLGTRPGDGDTSPAKDGMRGTIQLLLPARDVEVLDTWDVSGLRGSGSHDVAVHGIFVPEHRTTRIYGGGLRADTALGRYPIVPRFASTKPGVAMGIGRGAINALVELAATKPVFFSQTLLRDRQRVQIAVAEAEAILGAGRAFVFEAIGAIWAEVCAGREVSRELRVRQRLAAAHAVRSAVQAVDIVHGLAGSTANTLASPLERAFRDVHTIPQHITVLPAYYETAGRALLGLEIAPDTY